MARNGLLQKLLMGTAIFSMFLTTTNANAKPHSGKHEHHATHQTKAVILSGNAATLDTDFVDIYDALGVHIAKPGTATHINPPGSSTVIEGFSATELDLTDPSSVLVTDFSLLPRNLQLYSNGYEYVAPVIHATQSVILPMTPLKVDGSAGLERIVVAGQARGARELSDFILHMGELISGGEDITGSTVDNFAKQYLKRPMDSYFTPGTVVSGSATLPAPISDKYYDQAGELITDHTTQSPQILIRYGIPVDQSIAQANGDPLAPDYLDGIYRLTGTDLEKAKKPFLNALYKHFSAITVVDKGFLDPHAQDFLGIKIKSDATSVYDATGKVTTVGTGVVNDATGTGTISREDMITLPSYVYAIAPILEENPLADIDDLVKKVASITKVDISDDTKLDAYKTKLVAQFTFLGTSGLSKKASEHVDPNMMPRIKHDLNGEFFDIKTGKSDAHGDGIRVATDSTRTLMKSLTIGEARALEVEYKAKMAYEAKYKKIHHDLMKELTERRYIVAHAKNQLWEIYRLLDTHVAGDTITYPKESFKSPYMLKDPALLGKLAEKIANLEMRQQGALIGSIPSSASGEMQMLLADLHQQYYRISTMDRDTTALIAKVKKIEEEFALEEAGTAITHHRAVPGSLATILGSIPGAVSGFIPAGTGTGTTTGTATHRAATTPSGPPPKGSPTPLPPPATVPGDGLSGTTITVGGVTIKLNQFGAGPGPDSGRLSTESIRRLQLFINYSMKLADYQRAKAEAASTKDFDALKKSAADFHAAMTRVAHLVSAPFKGVESPYAGAIRTLLAGSGEKKIHEIGHYLRRLRDDSTMVNRYLLQRRGENNQGFWLHGDIPLNDLYVGIDNVHGEEDSHIDFALGIDQPLADNLMGGVFFSFSDNKGNVKNGISQDNTSIVLGAYGSYDLANGLYVADRLSYKRSSFSNTSFKGSFLNKVREDVETQSMDNEVAIGYRVVDRLIVEAFYNTIYVDDSNFNSNEVIPTPSGIYNGHGHINSIFNNAVGVRYYASSENSLLPFDSRYELRPYSKAFWLHHISGQKASGTYTNAGTKTTRKTMFEKVDDSLAGLAVGLIYTDDNYPDMTASIGYEIQYSENYDSHVFSSSLSWEL